jgi:hypothetical protein
MILPYYFLMNPNKMDKKIQENPKTPTWYISLRVKQGARQGRAREKTKEMELVFSTVRV